MQGVTVLKTARLWLMAALVLAVVGCASVDQTQMRRLPERVELNGVPFFRGNAHQSGPQVLASMLGEQHIRITPGLLTKPLKLPEAESSLQGNMEQLAGQYGLMVYPLDSSLSALLTQVSAGHPVMVRFMDGTVWTEPRYAVLAGYDRTKETVLLRAGMERRRLMDFKKFESRWKDAGSWAVLILSPDQLPANVDKARWLKVANQLSRSGQEQAGSKAIQALNTQK